MLNLNNIFVKKNNVGENKFLEDKKYLFDFKKNKNKHIIQDIPEDITKQKLDFSKNESLFCNIFKVGFLNLEYIL